LTCHPYSRCASTAQLGTSAKTATFIIRLGGPRPPLKRRAKDGQARWKRAAANGALVAQSGNVQCPMNFLVGLLFQVSKLNATSSRYPSQLIQPVQCSHLVSLCKGRVVEDAVPEKFKGALECKHRLANMNDFGRALSNDMNTEQFQCIGMEQDL
jgi:hypothetical protein